MKLLVKYSLFLLLSLISLQIIGQPDILWQNVIGGDLTDNAGLNFIKTQDNHFLLISTSNSDISGDKTADSASDDFWMIKMDHCGEIIWQKTIGGDGEDRLVVARELPSGGFILGGTSNSNSSGDKTDNSKGGWDYWLVKIDASGTVIWDKTFGGAGDDFLRDINLTADGGFIVGGYSQSNISGDKGENKMGLEDYWVVKTDALGALIWENTYGGNEADQLNTVIQTADGGYFMAGFSQTNTLVSTDKTELGEGAEDYWVIKTDALGGIVWENTIGGSLSDKLYAATITLTGDYVLIGASDSNTSGDKIANTNGVADFWLVEIDQLGAITGQNTIGGDMLDIPNFINANLDNTGYLIGGYSTSSVSGDKMEASLGGEDYWLLEVDFGLNKVWDKTLGGSDSDILTNVLEVATNEYFLFGYSNSLADGDKTETVIGDQTNGLRQNDLWTIYLSDLPSGATDYAELEMDFKDPLQTVILEEICNNDPVHFCQLINGNVPPPISNGQVVWEYNDNGTGWQDVNNSFFSGFCFVVPPTTISVDCGATNLDGFVDRAYRTRVEVNNDVAINNCDFQSTFYSDEDTLRVCCPITTAIITNVTGITELCEGQTEPIDFTLTSDPFVMAGGQYVTIEWKLDGNVITPTDPLSFSLNLTAQTNDIVLEVTITNCGGKTKTATSIIKVDPMPVCGTITGLSIAPTLIPDPSPMPDPNLFYICPGDDAVIGVDQAFMNCIPQWEYTFDLTGTVVWNPLGFSNTIQNTNVLPTNNWASGATAIYYRIACQPESTPSACDPCYGDTLEIRLLDAPIAVTITGTNPICEGNSTVLNITAQNNPVLPITYTWLHNGLVVGTGTSYTASEDGCYWVEANDGCQMSSSNQFCLDVCELVAVISCPLQPNECAYQGQSVTLTGCGSESSCSNANLTYQWAYDSGTLISTNGCIIEHLPDPAGTIYTLTVTDVVNGCTATTTRRVKPCAP